MRLCITEISAEPAATEESRHLLILVERQRLLELDARWSVEAVACEVVRVA
jgi:hypothetical protein